MSTTTEQNINDVLTGEQAATDAAVLDAFVNAPGIIDLVNVQETADELGVTRVTVGNWLTREVDPLPAPDFRCGKSLYYLPSGYAVFRVADTGKRAPGRVFAWLDRRAAKTAERAAKAIADDKAKAAKAAKGVTSVEAKQAMVTELSANMTAGELLAGMTPEMQAALAAMLAAQQQATAQNAAIIATNIETGNYPADYDSDTPVSTS